MPGDFIEVKHYSDAGYIDDIEDEATILLDENIAMPPKHYSVWRRLFRWALIVSLFCVPGILVLLIQPGVVHAIVNQDDTGDYGDCGSTIEEARARNCIFDNLSYSWHRPQCAYPDLVAQYHKRVNMTWYSDHSLEARYLLPHEEVLRGDHLKAWTAKGQHMLHCAFILEKIHVAYDTGGGLDSQARVLEHSRHCTEILLDDLLHELPCEDPPCERITHATASFTSCKRA